MNDREYRNAKQRKWRAANQEKVAAANRDYYKRNREKVMAHVKSKYVPRKEMSTAQKLDRLSWHIGRVIEIIDSIVKTGPAPVHRKPKPRRTHEIRNHRKRIPDNFP